MLPASAVPAMVGFVLLVVVLAVVSRGLSGAVFSTVRVIGVEAGEAFPAASLATAVIAWAPLARAVVGVKVHAPVEEATAVPSTVDLSYTLTVLRASAVPAMTGLVLLVVLFAVVKTGLSGAVVSTVNVIAFDAADTLPAASLAVAVITWAAAERSFDGVKVQAPVEDVTAVPSVVVPSRIVTVLSASAVPAITGFVLLVAALTVVSIGLSGAVRSIVSVMAVEAPDTFPAISVAVAVITWAAAERSFGGVKVHAPVADAVAVPSVVVPSRIVTVLSASAVPAITGLVLFVEEVSVVRTGFLGGVVSTVIITAVDAADTLPAASFDFAVIV